MDLAVAYDSSMFIRDSIEQVGETLLIALCLVILVVIAFMKSFRATLIPTLAIPVSIIGTFVVIYFLGFTINILTLLALVLAIGLVVDDAIVMLENIFRHMEMGKSRMQAAFDGSKEIAFAVLATTIDAGGGVRAGGVPDRLGRTAVPRVWLFGGHRRGDFRIRGADADADVQFAHSATDSRHGAGLGGAQLRRLLRRG